MELQNFYEQAQSTPSEHAERKMYALIPLRGKTVFPSAQVGIDVGRKKSLAAMNFAAEGRLEFMVCLQPDTAVENPTESDVASVGTICRVRQIIKTPGGIARLNLQGLFRARITDYVQTEPFMMVHAQPLVSEHSNYLEEQAYFRACRDQMVEFSKEDPRFNQETTNNLSQMEDADTFIDVACSALPFKEADKQTLLEETDVLRRLTKFSELFGDELEIARLQRKIAGNVKKNIDKNQKEYYLREQIRAIHTELGDDEEEKEELTRRVKAKKMPKEVEEKCLKEIKRMDRMNPSSPEYTVIHNYLDWMLDVPFKEKTKDNLSITRAKQILDEDHYGLVKVKQRIVEYLSVLHLTKQIKGPILCFVGPPGVGKTSIARSIARALGRKFVRMSLGGVRDEAEIRGHRRTYIGSMPGRILFGMKNAGSINPVFLLDEIDKVSHDMQGDPASALLEVLDPEQNATFRDRYLEVPYDLSKVLFVTTANSLETIPAPLLDRMEVIELSGYTPEEKLQIARRYLVPKSIKANGLKEDDLSITDGALSLLIDGYTMEAGVRNLERVVGSVCRKIAAKVAEHGKAGQIIVDEKDVEPLLGGKKYFREKALKNDEVGAVNGLAWTAVGGTVLTVEVSLTAGKGEVILTGKLGDVMKESARAALTFVRANAEKYGIDTLRFEKTDVHVHVPEGATPKDGPSAGVTMATAILSAFTGKKVRASVAMTGEITLRGNVLAIGGLKEKSLAAYRSGIHTVVIPQDNVKDLEEIDDSIRSQIQFVPVSRIETVFETAVEL